MTAPLAVLFDAATDLGTESLGGKGRGLVELTGRGLPVPPGYVVTAEANQAFLDETGVGARIEEVISAVTADRADVVDEVSAQLMKLVGDTALPPQVDEAVREGYRALCAATGVADMSVAVRSSATAEDSSAASFAGEFETWVDIVGEDDVVAHVLRCYQSMYVPRVLSYIVHHHGGSVKNLRMAVVVQKTVRARAAGVMFTLDPLTGDRSVIAIEANWGLGLPVVGGEVIPDRFVVNRVTGEVTTTIGRKEITYLRGDEPPIVLDEAKRSVACLLPDEVQRLSELGSQLHRAHGSAQDVEFAFDDELEAGVDLLLLQCRPETYWSQRTQPQPFSAGAGVMSWVGQAMTSPEATTPPRGSHDHD